MKKEKGKKLAILVVISLTQQTHCPIVRLNLVFGQIYALVRFRLFIRSRFLFLTVTSVTLAALAS
jgi:hypothetical protein